jgi:histidinol-phosphate aminotransferase
MNVPQEILELVPYQPGKPIEETKRELGLNEVYKLASNENPLGISPKAKKAIEAALNELHRYPDGSAYELKTKVASYYNFPVESITFGNGSNELIDFLIRIYTEPGDAILTSQAAFIAYKISAQVGRVRTIETPLTPAEDFQNGMKFDVKALIEKLKSAKEEKIKLVFIANPNNPTGTYLNFSEMEELLTEQQKHDDVMLVIDEAYLEFVRAKDYPRVDDWVKKYRNVVIMRTFSKVFGLAGLRLGALIAKPEVIDLVNRVRNPFNINTLAQVAAIAAMEDQEFILKTQQVTWEGLDYFYRELKEMGLKFWPSQGNFILFDTQKDAKTLFQALLREGVIMRPVQNYGLPSLMRLSVGLSSENQKAIAALKKVLKN